MGGTVHLAVVGEGLSAAGLALALCHTAQGRGRAVETLLYAGDEPPRGAPHIVTPQCRARLALLGCTIPEPERTTPLVGLRVLSPGARVWLPYPPGVVSLGEPGRDGLVEMLTARAGMAGARVRGFSVERTEPLSLARAPGRVVRSHGLVARADVVAFALEPQEASASAAEPEARAPQLPGAEAWMATRRTLPYAQLLLAPGPGVDALLLLPVPMGFWALAFGPAVEPVDLSLLLVEAARDGHLEPGFEVRAVARRAIPAGSARALTGPAWVASGPDALGHPLDLALGPRLQLAGQVARALVAAAEPRTALVHALLEAGAGRMRREVDRAAALWRAVRAAGPEAAFAFRAGRRPRPEPAELTLAGLERPRPARVLWRLRWEALRALAGGSLPPVEAPAAVLQPPRDPRLFYVVDDDPGTREGLREQLALAGAEVVSFAGEMELLAAVAHRPPAAVLLDVVLEHVDGIRLCGRLTRHPATRGTAVYVMSGLRGPALRRQAREAGAAGFLPKPIDGAELARILERHLPAQRERPASRAARPASSHTAA
ncbi:MAG TPA: response regulator [Myxococcaceae bacterium]|nr:response regulator [Myxococcaceae bacterium]